MLNLCEHCIGDRLNFRQKYRNKLQRIDILVSADIIECKSSVRKGYWKEKE
jgi:hypothetical protein